MNKTRIAHGLLLTWALLGCAAMASAGEDAISDPLEPANRAVYRFNDALDRHILRPVAVGYSRALPPQIRRGVRNFFDNATYPVTIVNSFLQGKPTQGGKDAARFVINTTVGLLGLFDPATEIGLARHQEDFGQTLAVWGVGEGPYLVVPFFGPRSLTHGIGDLVDLPLTPYTGNNDLALSLGLYTVESIDDRSRLLDVDYQVREAFDPYLFVRDAYMQNRRYRISDGNVAEDDAWMDEEFFEDEE